MNTDPKIVNSFAADGFVLLPRFLSTDSLADLSRQVDRFLEKMAPGISPEQVFYGEKLAAELQAAGKL